VAKKKIANGKYLSEQDRDPGFEKLMEINALFETCILT
jgi:hypothetical protein